MITVHHPWVFAFGILGNVISFMVFLAPLPTFIRVYKKKSTEGFQSIPYVVAIFSAMLWIYYAMLKGNSLLLITVNVAGVIIETIYVVVYITYAPRQAKMFTLKLLLFMNFGGFGVIVLLCHYLTKGETRIQAFGWVCVAFSVSVFAAPLSVMRLVIRTKSVEFMPFNLSLCLTLTATIWFFYGFVQKDLYITLPNIVGFVFGVVQMILYGIYRKYDKMAKKQKLPEQVVEITSPVKQNDTVETVINCLPKTKDIIHPQENNNVEVVIDANMHEINEEASNSHEVYLHGQPQIIPTTCNVDLESIVNRPGPCSVQLVECAV
ncbi:bidirectional sugar transporter N3-like [Silene latifolia]|uniref:bidirectional sugar transporter N3-like n=1 Tax=Silene latifolia TaxID=37657 RepID=UPI003D77F498